MGVMVHTQIRPRIKVKNLGQVEKWCLRKIGPRLFYLHNKRGGAGWKLYKDGYDFYLELEDPRLMTMFVLTMGDSL